MHAMQQPSRGQHPCDRHGGRCARQFHARKTEPAEDQYGVQSQIEQRPDGHRQPRRTGVARRPQDAAGDHGDGEQNGARIVDVQVAVDQRQHFRAGAKGREHRIDGGPADQRQQRHQAPDEHDGVHAQAAHVAAVARPGAAGDHRRGADADAERNAGQDHGDREGERHRRHVFGGKLADEAHLQRLHQDAGGDAQHHRRRQSIKREPHGALGQIMLRHER